MVVFVIGVFATCILFSVLGICFHRHDSSIEVCWRINEKQLYAVLGLLFIFCSFIKIVPKDFVGVLTKDGGAKQYTEGVYLICPWNSFEMVKLEKPQLQIEIPKEEVQSEETQELATETEPDLSLVSESLTSVWTGLMSQLFRIFLLAMMMLFTITFISTISKLLTCRE